MRLKSLALGGALALGATPVLADDVIHMATSFQIRSMDPVAQGFWMQEFGQGELLMQFQPDGTITPWLADSLTRTDDLALPLEDRAARANALDADVFVSLHLNAADEPVRIGGVTTFVLDTTNDRQAIRLAARENGTNAAHVSQLQRLLAGLHREEQLAGSRRLAEAVHRSTLTAGRRHLPSLPDRGVKSAMFYVLVGARMPAILLEASFLTKPAEADALKTDAYRQSLAQGIAVGILRYLAARAADPPSP